MLFNFLLSSFLVLVK